MQHEVTILCGLLARGDNGAHDADDVLEHAALRLWKTLLRGGSTDDKDAAVRALLHLEMKVWNRVPRLLLASSSGVVQAIIAVMCAATSHQSPPFCILDDEKGTVGSPRYDTDAFCVSSRYSACGEHDGTTEKNEYSLQRSIHERIWRSEWRQRIVEKIEDCYSLCLSQQTLQQQPLNGVSDSHLQWSKEAEICGRLMDVIGAVTRRQALRTHDADVGADNCGDESRARMSESIELFYSLCTSPIRSIAICASSNLLSILRGRSEASAKTTAKLFSDSIVVDHIAKWLTESGAVSSSASQKAAPAKNSRARHENDTKKEVLRLQCVYFDLLLFGASLSTATEETSYAIVDKVNILQLTTLFLSHTNAELQEKALRLLVATLQTSSPKQQTKVSVICNNIRISGLLISICWFMGHSHRGVADAAGKLMDAVIESSPTADILRALIEQGCAIIFSVVAPLNPASAEPEHATQSQQNQDGNPSGTLARNCCELLDWMATEIVSEQVFTIAVSSVLRSSNVLLQKNVILSLLLLSQRSSELKQLLESEENFLDEVVHSAIEASEDGSLAAVLLEATLSWCDKCSTLKLEDSGSNFRQSKDGSMLRDNVTRGHDDDTVMSSSIPPVIKIKHKSEVVVAEVDGMLLYKLCKLVRRFVDTIPLQQSREPQIQLSQFRVSAIQLFTEVLPKSQQEAVIILKSKDIAELSELLELSKYIECSKCWHFTTFALNHALTVVNWFDTFQFAIKIRHPSLMLRAGKIALACFEEDAARNGNNAEHIVSQAPVNSCGPSVRHFPELKAAAFEMFQEVFYADKSIRNPDQSDQLG